MAKITKNVRKLDISSESASSILAEYGCDIPSRTIYIIDDESKSNADNVEDSGEIDNNTARNFLYSMSILENISKDPIKIVLSTTGGQSTSGFIIIDRILASECHITIVATGVVMSMGIYILAAGNTRISSQFTEFMHHSIAYGTPGLTKQAANENLVGFNKQYQIKMLKYLTQHTKMPYTFWEKQGKHTDYYFDAERALEYGLIDEVIND